MNHGDAGAQRARRLLMQPNISARDAGGAFVKHFERPLRDERAERGALAEGFYRQYNGGGSSGAGGGSGPVLSQMQELRRSGQVINEQCVSLAKAAVNASGSVLNWRKGVGAQAGTLQPGTPVATFLNRDGSQSDRYAGGGTGTMGAGTDHAGVFQSYVRDKDGKIIGMNLAEQYRGSGGVKSKTYMFGQGFGEKNGSNYHAVMGSDGQYLGGSRNPMTSAPQAGGSPGGILSVPTPPNRPRDITSGVLRAQVGGTTVQAADRSTSRSARFTAGRLRPTARRSASRSAKRSTPATATLTAGSAEAVPTSEMRRPWAGCPGSSDHRVQVDGASDDGMSEGCWICPQFN